MLGRVLAANRKSFWRLPPQVKLLLLNALYNPGAPFGCQPRWPLGSLTSLIRPFPCLLHRCALASLSASLPYASICHAMSSMCSKTPSGCPAECGRQKKDPEMLELQRQDPFTGVLKPVSQCPLKEWQGSGGMHLGQFASSACQHVMASGI